MRIAFVTKDNGPERLVCEAEVIFDEPGPLQGLKLVGFSLWRGPDGEHFATLPCRPFGVGSDRRFFDLVRSTTGDAADGKRLKAWILEEYRLWSAAEEAPALGLVIEHPLIGAIGRA